MTARRDQASIKVRVDNELREQFNAKADELHLSTQHILEVCVRAVVLGLGSELERALTRHYPEDAARVMVEKIREQLDGEMDFFDIEQE